MKRIWMTAGALIGVLLLIGAVACSSDEGGDDGDTSTTATGTESATETMTATETASGSDATAEATATADDGDEMDGTANTSEVVAAVEALVATLSDDQVAALTYDFGDSAVTSSWSNLPSCGTDARAGIRHGDLSEEQLAAVLAVAEAALSEDGYAEYLQIIAADDVLGASSGGGGAGWDSDCYYMAVYGTPSTSEAWTLQFGGHHYARMITYEDGSASITPSFTGVEPQTFDYDGGTAAPLADEVEAIFAIFAALDDEQLATAKIDGAFDDVLLGPGEDDVFPETVGLAVSELNDEQQALVLAAMRRWVEDFDASIADTVMAQLEAELDETYISWASSVDPDEQGSYGRIDGPSVWIELVNQSGVGFDGIHHHSIYRDRSGDYGSAA